MSSTRVSRHVNAPRVRVYNALVDANAIATWMVPTGMTSHVHDGTDVIAVHEGLPPGLSTADNEAGWLSSLAKLAALVEAA